MWKHGVVVPYLSELQNSIPLHKSVIRDSFILLLSDTQVVFNFCYQEHYCCRYFCYPLGGNKGGFQLAPGEKVQHSAAISDPETQWLRRRSYVGLAVTVRRNAFKLPSFRNLQPSARNFNFMTSNCPVTRCFFVSLAIQVQEWRKQIFGLIQNWVWGESFFLIYFKLSKTIPQ